MARTSRSLICRRCKGRERVLIVHPLVLVVCVACACTVAYLQMSCPTIHRDLPCYVVLSLIAALCFVCAGGLWTECPVCWPQLTEIQCAQRRKAYVAKQLSSSSWTDTPCSLVISPLYRSALVYWTVKMIDPVSTERFINREIVRSLGFWVLVIVAVSMMLEFFGYALLLLTPFGLILLAWVRAIILMVVLLLCAAAIISYVRHTAVLLLRKYFPDEIIRRCTNCGYDLRGCTGTICPECGTPTEQKGSLRQATCGGRR